MWKKIIISLFISAGLSGIFTGIVSAQDDEFQIRVRKDFGYGMGSSIQGRFTISLIGDEEAIDSVNFYADDVLLQRVAIEPYKHQFQTDSFDPGNHRLYAEVLLKDGSMQTTSFMQYNFLSRKDSNRQMLTLFIGIGGAIIGSLLIVALIQTLVIKQSSKSPHQPGTPRNYGILGGTICNRCGRPFPRHIWGMNLVVGRFDRCNNCGKWSMTVRATPKALRLAEEELLESAVEDSPGIAFEKDEKDLLEETKYFDDI